MKSIRCVFRLPNRDVMIRMNDVDVFVPNDEIEPLRLALLEIGSSDHDHVPVSGCSCAKAVQQKLALEALASALQEEKERRS